MSAIDECEPMDVDEVLGGSIQVLPEDAPKKNPNGIKTNSVKKKA